ncbi:hypothetical protein TNCT_730451 [Trichonephila clavata]|uniref:Uncharacterized protein n=1 Tax=Trichonephila clavata TaxID=2740835 RepID=A0A8X6K276_TRICU|nr:hypothetical protein TNCT_730451 [Trichonephila clavata]
MSFLLKGEKEDLLELATELRLEATVDITKPMLKNLIISSAGYDKEDTKLMYEGIVEERKERELLEERKRQDNLELEKLRIEVQIGLNQEILSRNNRTPNHLSFNCPKAMKEIEREQPNSQVLSCSVTPQKGIPLKNISEVTTSPIDGAASEYMRHPPEMVGFWRKSENGGERDKHERDRLRFYRHEVTFRSTWWSIDLAGHVFRSPW